MVMGGEGAAMVVARPADGAVRLGDAAKARFGDETVAC